MNDIIPKVRLISATQQPLEVVYAAFRNCYSQKPPEEIWDKILSQEIDPTEIGEFIDEKLSTGHNSPLRLPNFVFIVDGVSRAFTAQFNRHTIGVGREEAEKR